MKTGLTVFGTLAVLELLRAIWPPLAWGVALFWLGICLGALWVKGAPSPLPPASDSVDS